MDLKIAHRAGANVCAARSSNSSDGEGLKAKVAHKLGRLLYSKYVNVKIAPSDLAAKYTFGKKITKEVLLIFFIMLLILTNMVLMQICDYTHVPSLEYPMI